MNECAFNENKGQAFSRTPILFFFPGKSLLAFAGCVWRDQVGAATTRHLRVLPRLAGAISPACAIPSAQLPVPSPFAGAQPLEARGPLSCGAFVGSEGAPRCAGPAPAYTWEPRGLAKRLRSDCLAVGKRNGEGRTPRSPAGASARHSGLEAGVAPSQAKQH